MSGVKPLREPVTVVSSDPTYSIDRAMRSTKPFNASAIPHGIGEPMNLWPLTERL